MEQLAGFYAAVGAEVEKLPELDRFESQSSMELIAIARLAMDQPRLKRLIGTLLFVDEMLDIYETKQQTPQGQ